MITKNLKTLRDIANSLMDSHPGCCLTHNVRTLGCIYILDDEYVLIDQLLDLFAYDILGLCGCGTPKDTWNMIRIVLNALNDKHEDKCTYDEYQLRLKDELHINPSEDIQYGLYQFVLYILNDKKILEHGSSVGGSFLTDLGKKYLTVLNIWHEEGTDDE